AAGATGAPGGLERTGWRATVAGVGVAVVAGLARLDPEVPAYRRRRAVDGLEHPAIAGERVRVHRTVTVHEPEEAALGLRDRQVDARRHVGGVVPPEAVLLADVEERHLVRDRLHRLDVLLRQALQLVRRAPAPL